MRMGAASSNMRCCMNAVVGQEPSVPIGHSFLLGELVMMCHTSHDISVAQTSK